MRFSSGLAVLTALATLLCATAAVAQDLPRGGDITCEGPFSGEETGEGLLGRFGSAAKIMELPDLTGEPLDFLVLYPDDPSTRLELETWDGNGTDRVTELTIKGPDSLWTVGGLRIGTSLDKLTDRNGRPLTLSGFWQQTGTTYTMIASMPLGECNLDIVMFAPDGVIPDHQLYGLDTIQSNDPRLAQFGLKIDQLTIMWPEDSGEG